MTAGGGQREVKFGSVWLLQGDCLDLADTAAMVRDGTFDHIITDAPYEASLHAAKGEGARPLKTDGTAELKAIDFAPVDEIRADIVDMAARFCGGWFLTFCTTEGTQKWAEAINPSQLKYKRACWWVKPDATPQLNGQGPAQGGECFVATWCGKGHAKWNAGGKRGVYTFLTNPRDRDGRHPTEKPVQLMVQLLLDFTKPGDLIFDPFMGSGTTAIACLKTGRRFVGVELSPKYFDVAVDRVRKFLAAPDMFAAPVPAPDTPLKKQASIFDDEGRA